MDNPSFRSLGVTLIFLKAFPWPQGSVGKVRTPCVTVREFESNLFPPPTNKTNLLGGSLFMFSADKKYILKTLRADESVCLDNFLPHYYKVLTHNTPWPHYMQHLHSPFPPQINQIAYDNREEFSIGQIDWPLQDRYCREAALRYSVARYIA